MTPPSAAEVRDFILNHVSAHLAARGFQQADLPDSFDLLIEGVIDSFGIVELVMALEQRFGFEIDFADLDVDDLTRIGPISRYVEERGRLADLASS